MNNTKLVKLLKTFSKKEINRFGDFVNSPFYNKNQNVIRLCDTVMDYYPEFNSADFTEEIIFSKLFAGEKFSYFKIKNIISDLYQLSISFLGICAYEKKGTDMYTEILNELHERKLESLYIQKEKQIKDNLGKIKKKDELYYYLTYQLAKINTSHFKFEKSGYSFDLIQKESDSFFEYSLAGLLRSYSKMLTNSNHGNVKFDLNMFKHVWDFVNSDTAELNPSCMIYRQIIKLELTKSETCYRELLDLKNKYLQFLPDEDIYYILLVLNSYTVYRLRNGDEKFYKDRYAYLKEIFERKFIPDNDIMYVNFISTFTSACMAEDLKWAEEFLNRYQKGISPAGKKSDTVNFCKAFLNYKLKNYNKALEFFAKTNFRLFLMKVMVKSYTLRIYYEQKMWDQAFSAIDAFRHYLKKEKLISEDQKSAQYEFMINLSELIKIRIENYGNGKNEKLHMLQKQINGMKSNPLGSKNWLLEKAGKVTFGID